MYPRIRSIRPELSPGLDISRLGSRRTSGRIVRGRRTARDLEELDGVNFGIVSGNQVRATSPRTVIIEPLAEIDPKAFEVVEDIEEPSSPVAQPVATQGFGVMSGSGGAAPAPIPMARAIKPLVQPR